MNTISSRQINLIMVLMAAGIIGFSYFCQYQLLLEPCLLCLMQRFLYILIGLLALLAVLQNPKQIGLRIYSTLIILVSVLGVMVAGRQVWLQHLPEDQIPSSCGPSFIDMLESFPITEILEALFIGDGNCADIIWQFMGFSMAEWSFLIFLMFIGINIRIWLKR